MKIVLDHLGELLIIWVMGKLPGIFDSLFSFVYRDRPDRGDRPEGFRGRGRGRGGRGGRGRGGFDRFGKREFDRHSGSEKT